MDLIDFREQYEASGDFFHLVRSPVTRYVPGRGAERPRVMLLSGSPGAAESNARKPYPGRSGVILEGLMGLAGLSLVERYRGEGKSKVTTPPNAYVTHMIKYLLATRFPAQADIRKSARWVKKEWEVLRKPPVIVTLGAPPFICFKQKVGRPEDIGYPFKVSTLNAWIYPLENPNMGLHDPSMRDAMEVQWEKLGRWLKEEGLT